MSKDESTPATKADLMKSNARIDKLEIQFKAALADIRTQGEDIAHIRGTVEGAREDITMMKDALISAVTQNKSSMGELFKTLRWFIVAITVGGMIAAGWSTLSATNGKAKVEATK